MSQLGISSNKIRAWQFTYSLRAAWCHGLVRATDLPEAIYSMPLPANSLASSSSRCSFLSASSPSNQYCLEEGASAQRWGCEETLSEGLGGDVSGVC